MALPGPTKLKATIIIHEEKGNDNIRFFILENNEISIELTNIGCAITAIYTPDRYNIKKNIVAGFADPEMYKVNNDYLGCIIGRYANRITNGIFQLDNKLYQLTINEPPNHLHGGQQSFSRKIWDLDKVIENDSQCGVQFSYCSPDGEEGYPGNLRATVTYLLNNENILSILYRATTDKSTPVNFTNHSYFNLTAFEHPTVLEHNLRIFGDHYTEKSVNNTSAGTIAPVTNTPLDFTKGRRIGSNIDCFPGDMGYDHNFILYPQEKNEIRKAAKLSEATTGREVMVYTDKPAIQVYTANYWDGTLVGRQGVPYQKHGGVTLETQLYPDSVNHAHFPDTILHPGKEYMFTTMFKFGVQNGC